MLQWRYAPAADAVCAGFDHYFCGLNLFSYV